jgi:hypothetical protein
MFMRAFTFSYVYWLIVTLHHFIAQYAHRECVQRWCNEKGDIICEICHEVSNCCIFSSVCGCNDSHARPVLPFLYLTTETRVCERDNCL